MTNTPTPTSSSFDRIRGSLVRGVRASYDRIIAPRSPDPDRRRREFILNVIVSSILLLVVVLDTSIAWNQLTDPGYEGISFAAFTSFALFFAALLFLSRKGLSELASYIFIAFYFLITTYSIARWGIELPSPVLSYAVVIVASSVLIGTRFGAAMTAVISVTSIAVGYLQVNGGIEPDLAWRLRPLQFEDTLENSLIYVSIMVISWLSNREIEQSLRRALRSEEALTRERDLLEMKVEERTRELKEAQLEKVAQLYRFAEFGRLSSGIFHDLINPLTAVSLTMEKLHDENKLPDQGAVEQVERAVRASKRMDSFIQTVRKQLRSEGSDSLFSVKEEIEESVDLLAHKARSSGIAVRIDASDGIETYGNPVRFFQVIVNLVSNALDSYQGADKGKAREGVTVSARAESGAIRVSVKDGGLGIPSSILPSIFDPFFTTKAGESGIGLGLSTTKQIIENDFGGSISVKSAEGAGSEFILSIPVRKALHEDNETES